MARRRLLPSATVWLAAALFIVCTTTPQVDPNVDTSRMPNTELALQRSLDRVDRTMGQLGRFRPGTTLRPVTAAEMS